MTLTIEELKEYVLQHYDPDEIIEILDITTEELLEYFEDKLIDKRRIFDDEVDTYNQG